MGKNDKTKISRRRFLTTTGIAAAGAVVKPGRVLGNEKNDQRLGNLHPGVAAIVYDPNAINESSVDLAVVRNMVDDGLMAITGETAPVAAMSHLLTEGTAGSKVAIKVNCINSGVPTRWEMVRAILERLVDAGIDPANVAIYDNHNITSSSNGFNSTNFPNSSGDEFDGLQFVQIDIYDPGGHPYPVPGTTCNLTEQIVNADYVINAPVLKTHWGVTDNNFHFTLGMKNHYGSIYGLAHSWPQFREMLGRISADPVHVQPKTILVALSALFGYYSQNTPGGYAENWMTFDNTHPNRVILSTDPISLDHIGIEMINHERALHGLTEKTDTYVEYAATTFGLGVYDFSSMTVYQWLGSQPNLEVAPLGPANWRLTWNAMNGAYGYKVFRSTNAYSGFSEVADITDPLITQWDENSSPPQGGYFYQVRAYNAFGASAPSGAVGLFPRDLA